jgi:hypothetical protein
MGWDYFYCVPKIFQLYNFKPNSVFFRKMFCLSLLGAENIFGKRRRKHKQFKLSWMLPLALEKPICDD